jgi:hypothetical protein
MSFFLNYFQLGLWHILDITAYDHILFVLVIAICDVHKHLKRLFINITAFTVGHSLTLALSALNIIHFDPYWIELGIPITIMFSALYNLNRNATQSNKPVLGYILITLFGLIHGLGFANNFKMISNSQFDFILELFSFNLGIEIGQLMFVFALIILIKIVSIPYKINQKILTAFVSGGGFFVALTILLNNI